jgi:hypothetical protein
VGTSKNAIRGIFRIAKQKCDALLHGSNSYLFEPCAAYPYAAGHFELIEVPLCLKAGLRRYELALF